MPKKVTVRDPNHPINAIKNTVKEYRKKIQALSNDELTIFIDEALDDGNECMRVKSLPRGQRIKYLVETMELKLKNRLIEQLEEQQEPQEES